MLVRVKASLQSIDLCSYLYRHCSYTIGDVTAGPHSIRLGTLSLAVRLIVAIHFCHLKTLSRHTFIFTLDLKISLNIFNLQLTRDIVLWLPTKPSLPEVHSTHPVNTEDGYAMIFLPFRVKPVVKPLETVAGAKEPAWTWASICGKCSGLSFALANYIIPSQLLPQKQALPLLNHAKEWSLMKRISWTKHKLPKPKHKYWWLFLLHCQQDEATVVRNVNPCRALVISLRMSPVVFSDLLKGLDDKSKDQFTSSYNKLQSPIANFNSCDYCLLFSYWQRHFLFFFLFECVEIRNCKDILTIYWLCHIPEENFLQLSENKLLAEFWAISHKCPLGQD